MARKANKNPELAPYEHLLGTMSDEDLAAHAGTSLSAVGRARRRLKIKAFEAPAPEGAEGGEGGEGAEGGEESGGTDGRSKISPFHDLVGKKPDREIAEMAGVSPEAVRMYRKRRSIRLTLQKPAPKVETEKKPGRRRSRLDPYLDLLGKLPDAEIAEKAGVTPENVRAFRGRHGIAADYRQRREEGGAGGEGSSGPVAWLVRVDNGDAWVVLATDLGDAASTGGRLLGTRGNVVGVERVGKLLR